MKKFFLFWAVICISMNATGEPSGDVRYITLGMKEISEGWNRADGKPFLKYYSSDPKTLMIEGGGTNVGVKDLVEHHVIPEKNHFVKMNVSFNNIKVRVSDDKKEAWSVANTEFKAETKKGKKIHNKGFVTMIWKKTGPAWRIVHSHSSSRPVKKSE